MAWIVCWETKLSLFLYFCCGGGCVRGSADHPDGDILCWEVLEVSRNSILSVEYYPDGLRWDIHFIRVLFVVDSCVPDLDKYYNVLVLKISLEY